MSDIIHNLTLGLRGGYQTSAYLERCNFNELAVRKRVMLNTCYLLRGRGLEMVGTLNKYGYLISSPSWG